MNKLSLPRCCRLAFGAACIALLISGCSGFSWKSPFSAYRMDIQQGNAITHEMVAKLKPGMTRAQVKFALGTPLIVDTFRTDRWDYVYYFDKPNSPREYRHIVVVFKGDRVERFEGDFEPLREGQGTLSIDKTPAPGTPSARAAIDGAASAPPAPKAPSSGGEPGTQASVPPPQKAPSSGSEPAAQDAQATKEKKPDTPAPAKERGYSEPITESLGF